MNEGRQHRAARGVFIVDATEPLGGHLETTRVLGQPAPGGGLILLAANRDPVDEVVNRTAVELGVLGTPALVLVAFGVWLVTGAALRPVERMRSQAAAASPKDRTVLTVPAGRDEIARLAVTLNDLLAAQQAALRAEQAFLADAGHELRTPLAILAGELEYADRPARSEAELRETITVAREETTRIVRLAEQLLLLAGVEEKGLRREPTDLRALAERTCSAWSATARVRKVEIVLLPGDPVTVAVDADRIRQVLDNLLANAVRHAPPGSTIEISAGAHRGTAELVVRDHGAGFPPDFLPFAFERFRRAEASRTRSGPALPGAASDSSGTGLGLALVRTIAEAHGGRAEAANCPPDSGGGAVLTLRLPIDASGASTTSP
jgi:two-component system OmpR family sensor kinase